MTDATSQTVPRNSFRDVYIAQIHEIRSLNGLAWSIDVVAICEANTSRTASFVSRIGLDVTVTTGLRLADTSLSNTCQETLIHFARHLREDDLEELCKTSIS